MTKWIDVYTELPKAAKEVEGLSNYQESNTVLVKDSMGTLGIGKFNPTQGWNCTFERDSHTMIAHIVTHWQKIEN